MWFSLQKGMNRVSSVFLILFFLDCRFFANVTSTLETLNSADVCDSNLAVNNSNVTKHKRKKHEKVKVKHSAGTSIEKHRTISSDEIIIDDLSECSLFDNVTWLCSSFEIDVSNIFQ